MLFLSFKMKQALNISILVCLALLTVLALSHVQTKTHYAFEGNSDYIIDLHSQPDLFLTIDPHGDSIKLAFNFSKVNADILVDSLSISLNKQLYPVVESSGTQIEKGTSLRQIARSVGLKNKNGNQLDLHLSFQQNGKEYRIERSGKLNQRTRYSIGYAMHDPASLLVPLFFWLSIALVIIRLGVEHVSIF